MGDGQAVDAVTAALQDPFGNGHMGCTAENLAERYGIGREDQDLLAVESHQHAASRAWEENRFGGQILPVEVRSRKGVKVFERDEHYRADGAFYKLHTIRMWRHGEQPHCKVVVCAKPSSSAWAAYTIIISYQA
ncbi:MAG: hypothetical protein AB2742_12420 [Candidatus Thiodiazotropha endolucinida]